MENTNKKVQLPRVGGRGAAAEMWDNKLNYVLGWITTPGDTPIEKIPKGKYIMNVKPI